MGTFAPRPRPATVRSSHSSRSDGRGRRRPPMVVKAAGGRKLVMEEVTILKRGVDATKPAPVEPISAADDDDVLFSSTVRLGPEPEILPKVVDHLIPTGIYAGTGFISSPAPSCVPFPTAFFAEREKADIATRSLRFLLRLDVA